MGTIYADFTRFRDGPWNDWRQDSVWIRLMEKTSGILPNGGFDTSNLEPTAYVQRTTADSYYYRLERAGGVLTASWSYDGSTWTQAWSHDFGTALSGLNQRVVLAGHAWYNPYDSRADYDYITVAPTDTTPPVVTLSVTPNPVLRGLPATATFTANDPESGIVSTTRDPTFPVDTSTAGVYSVSGSATNEAGLTGTATVTYTVLSANQAVTNLAGEVKALGSGTMEKPLVALLTSVTQALDRGDDAAAIDKLTSFISHVNAQSGKRIDYAGATNLISQAETIIASIRATASTP